MNLTLPDFWTSLECLPGTSTTTSHKAVDRIQHLLQCNIDEDLVLHTANLMKSLGLYDAGYNWVNIDDCYAEKSRDEKGFIVEDRKRFKSGMKNLTASIKELGFKTGIYGDSGWYTCAGYPGSFRNEQRDARTFQDWGFELLKSVSVSTVSPPPTPLIPAIDSILAAFRTTARYSKITTASSSRCPMP
jgi:hypothetical protein